MEYAYALNAAKGYRGVKFHNTDTYMRIRLERYAKTVK